MSFLDKFTRKGERTSWVAGETATVAFCTTCMNRLEHLQQTLPQNMADNPNAVFVVLNYGKARDTQATEDWVLENFQQEIADGRLIYASFPYTDNFHMAHAKNVAHRIGAAHGADILVNVDADNIVGQGFDQFVIDHFKNNPNSFLRFNVVKETILSAGNEEFEKAKGGASGRIAVKTDDFFDVGGYNEEFQAWGGDDSEFSSRLAYKHNKPFGGNRIPLEYVSGVIHHADDLRSENYTLEAADQSRDNLTAVSHRSSIDKFARMLETIRENTTASKPANPDGNYGCGTVYITSNVGNDVERSFGTVAPRDFVSR